MTNSQRVERLRMALAEAGYPDAEVSWDDAEDEVMVMRHRPYLGDGMFGEWDLPADVVWRAYVICGETSLCLGCWRDRSHQEPTCDHQPAIR